ncbi:H-2 class I histocompatibility alpha chain-like protein [Labeo rohita]|uniref:H-2 class I histocompatibility alpha chain-like protein n=1 Tax=Labeo rohita TaxID=84645 RepID=A0A498LY29_LABRO|nr:H-2 class I histocompatibility alpha chain-like protein [Labeo rohita]
MPRRLRFKELSSNTLGVTWKEPKGAFDSYRLVYSTDSGDERELLVSKSEPKAVVEGFDRSKEYSVKITAVRGAEQSKALLGRYTGSGSEVSDVSAPLNQQDTSAAQQDNEINEGQSSGYVDQTGMEMRTEHHLSHKGQMSSHDDENGMKMRLNSDRGEMSSSEIKEANAPPDVHVFVRKDPDDHSQLSSYGDQTAMEMRTEHHPSNKANVFIKGLPRILLMKHYLHYKFTVLTKANKTSEYSAVGVYDDRQIKHYSNDWTKSPVNPPDFKNWFIYQIRALSNCTDSQCSELHVLQRIMGCELEKLPNGTVHLRAFDEYAFDGEDFIAFDSDTQQWIDKNPKAKETKRKWDLQTVHNHFLQYFLKNCMNWISTFNNTNTTPPDVHVFARKVPGDHSKLNLTCLATGFYPRDIEMNISLDGTVLGNQISSGFRPNDDETFQMRTSVEIDRNHKGSYDCFVIHSSLTEPVSVELDGKCFDCETESPLPVRAVVVLVPVVVLTLIGYFICKRKRCNGKWKWKILNDKLLQ